LHLVSREACALGLVLSIALGAAGCASAGGRRASLSPLDASECAKLATGLLPNGRSAIAEFDSAYARALRNPNRRGEKSDTLRLDREPFLLNGDFIAGQMGNFYPPALLEMKRGGTTMLAMLIHADGTPDPIRVFRSSREVSLDEASVSTAEQFRFSPGIYRGCPVFVFVLMPVNWVPGPPPRR
jgi:TonB family protein